MEIESFQRLEVRSQAELLDWLERNHGQPESVWLVTWKAAHPDLYVSREAVLDALVAYGWIDGRRLKLDDERTMQLISARKQQVWARSYKERATRLRSEGKLRPSGEASFLQAQQAAAWTLSDPIDDLIEPADLKQELAVSAGLGWWEASAPSYRRNILRWLASAKRQTTRTKRIGTIVDSVNRRSKVPQF